MTPEVETTTALEQAAVHMKSDLFADLFNGSAVDSKTALDHLMENLDILPYLDRLPARTHSWARNRPMPLAKVTNGNWTTARARKDRDGRLVVADPTRFFDAHLEIGVKLGTTILAVLVHHETSPYIVESKLASVVDDGTAETYRLRRKEFAEEFGRLCIERKEQMPKFRLARQWMLIGSAEYDFNQKTVTEVSKWLAFMIDEITDVINWTMFRLDARARFIAENGAVVIEPWETKTIAEETIADGLPMADDVPFTDEGLPVTTMADGEQLPFPSES